MYGDPTHSISRVWLTLCLTHICGIQLFIVIDAGHSDLTLTTHGEVVGVGGDERHFCGQRRTACQLNLLEFCCPTLQYLSLLYSIDGLNDTCSI